VVVHLLQAANCSLSRLQLLPFPCFGMLRQRQAGFDALVEFVGRLLALLHVAAEDFHLPG
jgi:hypothetical protein